MSRSGQGNSTADIRERARELYATGKYTLEDVAGIVGYSASSVSGWVKNNPRRKAVTRPARTETVTRKTPNQVVSSTLVAHAIVTLLNALPEDDKKRLITDLLFGE